MICGTATSLDPALWDQPFLSPGGPTGANGVVIPFAVILPIIHTLYVLRQEVL